MDYESLPKIVKKRIEERHAVADLSRQYRDAFAREILARSRRDQAEIDLHVAEQEHEVAMAEHAKAKAALLEAARAAE